MKDRCAICYGQIRTIDVDGGSVREELGTHSGRTFPRPSVGSGLTCKTSQLMVRRPQQWLDFGCQSAPTRNGGFLVSFEFPFRVARAHPPADGHKNATS